MNAVRTQRSQGGDSAATEGERSVEPTHEQGWRSEGAISAVRTQRSQGGDSAATEGERSVEPTHEYGWRSEGAIS